jgi:hypothetical protein
MSVLRSMAMIAAATVAWTSAILATAEDKNPEAVLAGKGLVRQGRVYLLPKVEDAIETLGLENMKLEMAKMRTGLELRALEQMPPPPPVNSQRQGRFGPPMTPGFPGSMPPPPSDGIPGFGNSAGLSASQRQLTDGLSRLSDQEMVKALIERKAGIEGLNYKEKQVANLFLFKRLLGQYDQMAADPQVKAALRELNKGREVKYAVGPPPAYESRIVTMAAEMLHDKGLRINKNHSTFSPIFDDDMARGLADAVKLRDKSQAIEKSAARAEARLASLSHEKNPRATTSPGNAKGTRVEGPRADDPARQLSEAATLRANFVKLVSDWRRRADEAEPRRKVLADDPEVKEALADLDHNRTPKQKHKVLLGRKFEDNLKLLASLEGSIVSRSVALEPDRDRLWVEASLDDSSPRKMVVDPKVPIVRLSSRTASSLKLKIDGAPTAEVKGDDGQTLLALRTTLKTLRVGESVANDVACLVMPETYGDAPSILGGTFLNHFVVELDSVGGKLSLTQVSPPPSKGSPSPATESASKP